VSGIVGAVLGPPIIRSVTSEKGGASTAPTCQFAVQPKKQKGQTTQTLPAQSIMSCFILRSPANVAPSASRSGPGAEL